MTEARTNDRFEQMLQIFAPQNRLLRAWKVEGGVSAQVTALEVELPNGQTKKMLVRQHGELDLRTNPHIAADEFKLLHLLQSVSLATPMPYYLDQSGEIFSTPYIVLEYIEGEPEFALSYTNDPISQLARHLVRIHQVDCSRLDLSFLPQHEERYARILRGRPAIADEASSAGEIRDVLEAHWPFPQKNASVLLHGDFWPGNILWRGGQIVGVIDWEDAALGDPLADLANSRLEILWAFGIDAMQRFTQHYQSMTTINFSNLPYWDLCAALRTISNFATWAANAEIEKVMHERHQWFVTQAFTQLAML